MRSGETFEAARNLLAEVLARPPETMPDDAAVGVTPGWDSIGHINVVLAIEARIGRLLSPDEIGRLRALTDIADLL